MTGKWEGDIELGGWRVYEVNILWGVRRLHMECGVGGVSKTGSEPILTPIGSIRGLQMEPPENASNPQIDISQSPFASVQYNAVELKKIFTQTEPCEVRVYRHVT
jgi:hypothetical protein